MLSPWCLVVRGSDVDLVQLKEVCVTSAEHTFLEEEPGEWRLRSSTIAQVSVPGVAWLALRELLGRLADVAAAAADDRVRLTPAALGRTRPDGHVDVFVFPDTARARARAFPPSIAINGVMPEPRHVKLLRLEATNRHLRLAIHFLNANQTWFDLWKAFEAIREACGGERQFAISGWATRAEIDRFRGTANSYHAVGDEARHALLRHLAPPHPMSLDEADDFVRDLLARYVDSLS